MNSVYDNGAILIGNIDLVIKEIQKEIKEDLDMLFVDKEELLKDLLELKASDKDVEIVYIDYESYVSNYRLNWWSKADKIKEK